MAERDTEDKHLRRERTTEIANEFAYVHVRKVHTRNGERLEIESPRRGRLIRLDPLELEAIACQDDESFLDTEGTASSTEKQEIEDEKEER
jgi:hypothetical protein